MISNLLNSLYKFATKLAVVTYRTSTNVPRITKAELAQQIENYRLLEREQIIEESYVSIAKAAFRNRNYYTNNILTNNLDEMNKYEAVKSDRLINDTKILNSKPNSDDLEGNSFIHNSSENIDKLNNNKPMQELTDRKPPKNIWRKILNEIQDDFQKGFEEYKNNQARREEAKRKSQKPNKSWKNYLPLDSKYLNLFKYNLSSRTFTLSSSKESIGEDSIKIDTLKDLIERKREESKNKLPNIPLITIANMKEQEKYSNSSKSSKLPKL